MDNDSLNIADFFPPLSAEDWRSKVGKDLKGASVDTLSTRLFDGSTVSALYTVDDAADERTVGVPGAKPYVRGGAEAGQWIIRQEYDAPRLSDAKSEIEADVVAGVEGLWLRVGPGSGIRALCADHYGTLLENVDLSKVSVCLAPGEHAFGSAAAFVGYARRAQTELSTLRGSYGADPLGALAGTGSLGGSLRHHRETLVALAHWSAKHTPSMRAALIDAEPYHNAGATEVQELAWSLGTAVEYLRWLCDGGLDPKLASEQFIFAQSVSGDFFAQIAKLRALRWLWHRVLTACDIPGGAASFMLHCRTSTATKTQRDPWVNMLRGSAETTAAAIGGAQSIASTSFDVHLGPSDVFARRVARNTQLVLREESHLGHVIDAGGGSWYIESLTEQFARGAWALFQEIEAQGGFASYLCRAEVAKALALTCEQRMKSVARRKTAVVGVNEFANLDETLPERPPLTEADIESSIKESLSGMDPERQRDEWIALSSINQDERREATALFAAAVNAAEAGGDLMSMEAVVRHGHPDLHIEPLEPWSDAAPWQELRDRSDRAAREDEGRHVFAANLGPIAAHKTRSMWVQNLLAAAGIRFTFNEGFGDVKALVDAFSESGASAAVVCGDDETYGKMAEAAARALKEGGCEFIALAGRPRELEASLRDAGVEMFLYAGDDVLDKMRAVHDRLGVDR